MKGKVLVLDDEQMIRDMVEMMLSKLGYEVTTVTKGEDAISAYEKAHQEAAPFDLVIADLTIDDGMGGKEAADTLRARYPSIKVVVSSGYAKDPVMLQYEENGFCDVIAKPYNVKRLQEVLDLHI